jgi:hypothetical protein
VVAALAGDWTAARHVQLDLPETGVCSRNLPLDTDRIDSSNSGCCGTTAAAPPAGRGLATGIAGGLLSAPLTLLPVTATAGERSGGCCD